MPPGGQPPSQGTAPAPQALGPARRPGRSCPRGHGRRLEPPFPRAERMWPGSSVQGRGRGGPAALEPPRRRCKAQCGPTSSTPRLANVFALNSVNQTLPSEPSVTRSGWPFGLGAASSVMTPSVVISSTFASLLGEPEAVRRRMRGDASSEGVGGAAVLELEGSLAERSPFHTAIAGCVRVRPGPDRVRERVRRGDGELGQRAVGAEAPDAVSETFREPEVPVGPSRDLPGLAQRVRQRRQFADHARGVILPRRFPGDSVNQRFPSGPSVRGHAGATRPTEISRVRELAEVADSARQQGIQLGRSRRSWAWNLLRICVRRFDSSRATQEKALETAPFCFLTGNELMAGPMDGSRPQLRSSPRTGVQEITSFGGKVDARAGGGGTEIQGDVPGRIVRHAGENPQE